jgi:predicted small lipoprotein YifL
MKRCMRPLLFCLLLVGSLGRPCIGQVIDTDRGRVEFIGLETWTAPQLVDSLRAVSPNTSLHACAATLKGPFGFPDASVVNDPANDGLYTVVTVIEPRASDRVQYRDLPPDTLTEPDGWERGLSLAEHRTFGVGLQQYADVLSGRRDSARSAVERFRRMGVEPDAADELWDFLLAHDHPRDQQQALWVLAHDRNFKTRRLAAAILANFPDSDLVWWHLVDALRDPDARVRSTASFALKVLSDTGPRRIDWTPATNTLRYLLGGTNPFAFPTVLRILSETSSDRRLMEDLFEQEGGELVQAYLQADHAATRNLAIRFLEGATDASFEDANGWIE